MQVHFSPEHGFHVRCDRCGEVARADGEEPVWVEWGHSVHGIDDSTVTCASCNKANPDRTATYDAPLGDVLIGVLANAHEPIAGPVERAFPADEFFGEGDLPWLVAEIRSASEIIDRRSRPS
jgi:hypothetical protein